MALMEEFKTQLAALDLTKPVDDNSETLQSIASIWDEFDDDNIRVTDHLKGNILFSTLAQVMEEKYDAWRVNFPDWISTLLNASRTERDYESEFFPKEHLHALELIYHKYLVNCRGRAREECVSGYRYLMLFAYPKELLLQDDEVYNIIKSNLELYQLLFLSALTGNEKWMQKMLNDQDLILKLLAVPETGNTNQMWDVFFYLGHHPDAKTLLPKEVILKVSQSRYPRRMELCALLCSEDDLKVLQLDEGLVSAMVKILSSLITKGTANANSLNYNLLNIILPVANLSIVEAMKETLGIKLIPLLIQVITEDLPATIYTTKHIPRARQEATKALWNLAYVESNRAIISKENGIDKLTKTLTSTEDAVLKKNIAGILHMFTNNPTTVEHKTTGATKESARGHVMISYNWGNQPIVKRIAKELQERGYNVWLDIEQMGGSTLEAMADAIEHSELVLICMSQKYKDSPNCRLEGEYCVNRKVAYIPLMMQKGYRPDGWLGITLGSKLYYEFSDEENWDFKVKELVKAIGDFGKSAGPAKVLPVTSVTPQPTIVDWTDADLLQWMKERRIDKHYELFKKHNLCRQALLELQQLHDPKNPTFFFNLFEKLGISECGEILLLSAAVRNLK